MDGGRKAGEQGLLCVCCVYKMALVFAVLLLEALDVAETDKVEHLLGVRVNLDLADIDDGLLGNVVVLLLALLFLELVGDTTDGSALNALHQVGDESSDLVTHGLGGHDGDFVHDLLVGVEVGVEARVVLLDDEASSLLDGLSSDSTLKEKRRNHKERERTKRHHRE